MPSFNINYTGKKFKYITSVIIWIIVLTFIAFTIYFTIKTTQYKGDLYQFKIASVLILWFLGIPLLCIMGIFYHTSIDLTLTNQRKVIQLEQQIKRLEEALLKIDSN
jgi:hypothetical protein